MDHAASSTPILGNRYQLLQTLGTGGMAVVYRARDLRLERPVAIKVLREDYSKNETFRQQFRQEALAAANLSHPNIVTVHDFGLDEENLFLVMEYIPGTNLKAILKQRGALSVEESLNLMIQACAGVGYAHRAGLVHCDIKPHNMLVTPDFRLKVTDFGIARALASIHADEQYDVVWGSPSYLSPEQAAGLAPSPASDVYSLGIVLYEALTGKLPFVSDDPVELIQLNRNAIPASPSKVNPQISRALDQIILKVLSKEPAARYRTADQFGHVLETYLKQNSASARPEPVSQPVKPHPQPAPIAQPDEAPPAVSPTAQHVHPPIVEEPAQKQDWGTILLGLVTILAVGGLIPFWLYIWLSLSTAR